MTFIHAGTDLDCWSREHWLGHCEGFRVEDRAQKLGIVQEIFGDEDEPEELVVRGSLLVEPRAERILLRMDRELER
jgi:hypothetical protein